MVRTEVPPTSPSVGTQPASVGAIGTLCFNESKAPDFEKLADLMSFPGIPSRASVQGLVDTSLEMCAVDLTEVHPPAIFMERSMQLGLSEGVAAELGTGWNLDTKSRRDKCSSELRTAKPKILIANPPCPSFLKLHMTTLGNQTSWSPRRTQSSQHYLTIHRTRRPGMRYVQGVSSYRRGLFEQSCL